MQVILYDNDWESKIKTLQFKNFKTTWVKYCYALIMVGKLVVDSHIPLSLAKNTIFSQVIREHFNCLSQSRVEKFAN